MTETGLDAAGLSAAFPFHIVVDAQLEVVDFGPSLPLVIPGLERGRPVGDYLRIVRPSAAWSRATLEERHGRLVVLEAQAGPSGPSLRGQLVRQPGGLWVFVGVPAFTCSGEASEAGLGASDFAAHDTSLDLQMMLELRETTLAELRRALQGLAEERDAARSAAELVEFSETAARAMANAETLEQALEEIVVAGRRVLGADAGVAMVRDADLEPFTVAVFEGGVAPPAEGLTLEPEAGVVGLGVRASGSTVVQVGREPARFPLLTARGINHALISPVPVAGCVRALLLFGSRAALGGDVAGFGAALDRVAAGLESFIVRREIQRDLERTQVALRRVTRTTDTLLFTISPRPDARLTFISDGSFEQLGITAEELSADLHTWLRHMAAEHRPRWVSAHLRATSEGVATCRYAVDIPGRGRRWREDELRRVDATWELVGTSRDVTREQTAEIAHLQTRAALDERESQLQAVFQDAEVGIAVANTELETMELNRAACDLVAGAPGADPTRCLALLDTLLEPMHSRISSLEAGEATRELLALPREGGEPAFAEACVRRVPTEGAPLYSVVLSDVTAAHRTQVALERARLSAEQASAAKSEFMATVSHEVRTPLNAILGMTDLALEARSPEEIRAHLQRIRSNGDRLLEMLRDVLMLAQIESGELEIRRAPFEPLALCERLIERAGAEAEAKGLHLWLDFDPEVPQRLFGDARKLGRTMNKLLSNAIRFTDAGSVTLRMRPTISEARAGIRVEVEDTGMGMDAEVQARVFEKFYRGETRLGANRGGAGLGLSVAQGLCMGLGGTILCKSEPGVGSTFSMEIPAETASEVSSIYARAPLSGARVRLAIAEPMREALVSSWLEAAGVCVDCGAGSGLTLTDGQAGEGEREREREGERERTVIHLGRARPGSDSVSMAEPMVPTVLLAAVAEGLGLARVSSTDGAPTQGRSAADRAGRTILLAEDNPDNAKLAIYSLEKAGYTVEHALDGLEAVERVRAGAEPEMIVMDVEMPGCDGLEATAKIRARESELGAPMTPIVALTAHAVQEVRERCKRAGMNDYRTKPIQGRRLVEMVDHWVFEAPGLLVLSPRPAIRALLRHYVIRDGRFRVAFASDAAEAAALITESIPHLLLSDLHCPGLTELHLCLRERAPYRALIGLGEPRRGPVAVVRMVAESLCAPLDPRQFSACLDRYGLD